MEHLSIVAKWLSNKAAQPLACVLAFIIILVWGLFGLPLHFSDTWQLIISTLAAVISIIMLFIIQNSQNRHTIAIQLKLDEIIRATQGAHNEMMDIEKLTDEDLARIQKKYGLLVEKTKEDLKKGKLDTHTRDISKAIVEEKNSYVPKESKGKSAGTIEENVFNHLNKKGESYGQEQYSLDN